MAQTKVKSGLIDASFGTDWNSTIQTSNFTATAGAGYFVNTTSAQITVTLPAGTVGDEIIIQDYAGTFATNKVNFAADGSEKIQGSASDYRCVTNFATCTLIYQDSTKGWTAANIEEDVVPPLVVNYLVCAGGGAGSGVLGVIGRLIARLVARLIARLSITTSSTTAGRGFFRGFTSVVLQIHRPPLEKRAFEM